MVVVALVVVMVMVVVMGVGVVVGEEEEYAGGYRLLRKQPDFSVCRSVG